MLALRDIESNLLKNNTSLNSFKGFLAIQVQNTSLSFSPFDLNEVQPTIFNEVVRRTQNQKQRFGFADGLSGSGKTFLFITIVIFEN